MPLLVSLDVLTNLAEERLGKRLIKNATSPMGAENDRKYQNVQTIDAVDSGGPIRFRSRTGRHLMPLEWPLVALICAAYILMPDRSQPIVPALYSDHFRVDF